MEKARAKHSSHDTIMFGTVADAANALANSSIERETKAKASQQMAYSRATRDGTQHNLCHENVGIFYELFIRFCYFFGLFRLALFFTSILRKVAVFVLKIVFSE